LAYYYGTGKLVVFFPESITNGLLVESWSVGDRDGRIWRAKRAVNCGTRRMASKEVGRIRDPEYNGNEYKRLMYYKEVC
jgi:hypothetical protein